ncbi:putative neutral ceramidase superfamily lipid hydrolase [Salibacterium salarium]|uniref:hypothetical protein n=1 Tax=Salibacterium salarium TaxID=284579 RepID=UPI0027855C5A|nr:hypothetical protein [Salibacterium salarium]MDQ0300322.1 putative neutral ceramidase superfamily lipid hydrolase [Salibacterium salarium]
MSDYRKALIWILVPLVYGFLVSKFMIITPLLSQIVFGLFWFWVGMTLANLKMSNVKSFLFGNSIWIVSILLFVWQFLLLDDSNRNMLIAAISQYYMSSFIWFGSQLSLAFSNVLNGTTITLLAYFGMFLVFSFGFITGKIKS